MANSAFVGGVSTDVRSAGCALCGSLNQRRFTGEIAIHFPGLKGIDKPIVWVFPDILTCLDCGASVFAVPEAELRVLAEAA
ncbi:MAG TPA: hypothetical protein VGI46_02830 [Candidatus Acidoferrum sp.]|jgi:hypothetical protein